MRKPDYLLTFRFSVKRWIAIAIDSFIRYGARGRREEEEVETAPIISLVSVDCTTANMRVI